MHTCALAFHLGRLDFQSLLDHRREEEREEKGKNCRLLLESLYNMHLLGNICSMPSFAPKDRSHQTLWAHHPCVFPVIALSLIVIGVTEENQALSVYSRLWDANRGQCIKEDCIWHSSFKELLSFPEKWEAWLIHNDLNRFAILSSKWVWPCSFSLTKSLVFLGV